MTPPSRHPAPLLEGAFDTHIRVAPDVAKRIVADVSLARRCLELGMAGEG